MSTSNTFDYSSVFDIAPTTPLDTFLAEGDSSIEPGVLEVLNNIIEDLRQVKIEPAPISLPGDEKYQEERIEDPAYLPTPEEFIHLTSTEHDWYHLKWRAGPFHLQIDTLQILDSHMRIVTMAIGAINQISAQHGNCSKMEISFLLEMRLDLWTQYKAVFQEMYRDGEFHLRNAPILNDLRNRNGHNLFIPRPKFRWIQYNPPYTGMPYIRDTLTNCGRCRRDGHDQPECPFDWYNPRDFPIQNTLRPDEDVIAQVDQMLSGPSQPPPPPVSNRKTKARTYWKKKQEATRAKKQKEVVRRSKANRRNAGDVQVDDQWSNAWAGLADWN